MVGTGTGTVRIPFVRIMINTTNKCSFLALKMSYIKTMPEETLMKNGMSRVNIS
jgi:hypothetical protein